MPNRRWDRDKIVASVQAGATAAELAQQHGVSIDVVWSLLRRYRADGLLPQREACCNSWDKNAIVTAVRAGVTTAELARQYDVTVKLISSVVSRYRAQGLLPPAPNTPRVLTGKMLAELAGTGERGASQSFARKYGLHKATVSLYRSKYLGLRRTVLDWFNLDQEVLRRRKGGASARQIATAIGVSPTAVRERLRLYGQEGPQPRAPRHKQRRVSKSKPQPAPPVLFYPEGSEGHELWNRAAAIVTRFGIREPQVRKDMTQELCVAVLLGDVAEDGMAAWVKRARAAAYGPAHDPRNLSLDAPLGEGGGTLYDLVAAE